MQRNCRLILTLFAAFVLSMHAAVFLHEVGHAVGYWIGRGKVYRLTMLAPLPAGYVTGKSPNPWLPVWGGVVFGLLSAALPLLVTQFARATSLLRFAALITAAFCFGHNGVYLFAGGITPFADATSMIHLGARRWMLISLGVPVLAAFVVTLANALRALGLGEGDGFKRWILITESGLLPVPAAMLVGALVSKSTASIRAPMSLLVITYAICFALAAWRARATILRDASPAPTIPQRWSTCGWLAAAAVLVIVIEVIAFPPP